MSWKWHTDVLDDFRKKCAHCQQPLRINQDGGLVEWTDGEKYHVGCLLDRLAAYTPVPNPIHWAHSPFDYVRVSDCGNPGGMP
jgi:hypothetical protein